MSSEQLDESAAKGLRVVIPEEEIRVVVDGVIDSSHTRVLDLGL